MCAIGGSLIISVGVWLAFLRGGWYWRRRDARVDCPVEHHWHWDLGHQTDRFSWSLYTAFIRTGSETSRFTPLSDTSISAAGAALSPQPKR
jgi:hypothetical protein